MPEQFSVHCSPSSERYRALADLEPHNPFVTEGYAVARAQTGVEPRIFQIHDRSGSLIGGCVGFLRGGALSRTLEVTSAPRLPQTFWSGVEQHCREQHVWELHLESFGSPLFEMPTIGSPIGDRRRTEYVLDLIDGDVRRAFSTNHRRNLQRAEKNGLTVHSSRDPGLANVHTQLMEASSQRRVERGEAIANSNPSPFVSAALASGAGELFYARLDNETVSSLFVLRARKGGYYHSAGTSPVGMKLGASVLVVAHAMQALRADGATQFNLGGADPSSEGLRRFKTGFGARPVELSAATFSIVPSVLRKLRTFVKDLRDDRRALLSRLCTIEHYVVYRATPQTIAGRGTSDPTLVLRKLSDTDLENLAGHSEFAHQAQRFHTLTYNAAYGLYARGELVHVAWLITPELDSRTPVRNVRLSFGEVEITHCETHSAHRGRGHYAAAIRGLCQIAADAGATTVFMITGSTNQSSQKGIERAGFAQRGRVHRAIFPVLGNGKGVVLRGHRWSRG